MYRLRILAVSMCAAAAAFLCCSDDTDPVSPDQPTDTEITWASTSVVYDTTIAKKDHSVVFFLASWCGWCKKLKENALVDPGVVHILDSAYNAIRIDPDADTMVYHWDSLVTCREYTQAYQVSAYPMMIFFDRRGNVLSQVLGYQEPDTLLLWLRSVLSAQ